jgi:hypothetical protein
VVFVLHIRQICSAKITTAYSFPRCRAVFGVLQLVRKYIGSLNGTTLFPLGHMTRCTRNN